MPLFPVLDIESKVQEKDKTRLDASRSYVSGVADLTTMTIKPSGSDTAVNCFTDGYLDWQYDFTIDVSSGVNDKVDFKEGAGAELTASIPHSSGTYEVTRITCVADVAGSLNNKTFFIYGETDSYACWINVSSGGTDPSIPGFTSLEVAISTEANANQVASAVASALDGLADFSATNNSPTVTCTNVHVGNRTAPDSGNTGFTVTVLTSGSHYAYTLAQFASELKTQMDAEGALTYTVSVSDDNKVTISSTGEFSLLPETGTNSASSPLPVIGFSSDIEGESEYEGSKVEEIEKTLILTINNGTTAVTLEKNISVISELADNLFSSDDGLRKHEPEIFKYLPSGRSSFKDVHRRSQELILNWLDSQGYVTTLNEKFTAQDIVDITEFRDWSTVMTLRLIFEGLSNATEDVFHNKAQRYAGLEDLYRNRAVIRIDTNDDGILSNGEGVDIRSSVVVRR